MAFLNSWLYRFFSFPGLSVFSPEVAVAPVTAAESTVVGVPAAAEDADAAEGAEVSGAAAAEAGAAAAIPTCQFSFRLQLESNRKLALGDVRLSAFKDDAEAEVSASAASSSMNAANRLAFLSFCVASR